MEIRIDITRSCRVCGNANQDDFEKVVNDNDELTMVGKLYEETLGLKINLQTVNYYPQFICKSCELQMKLFKRLKNKAEKFLDSLEAKISTKLAQEKKNNEEDLQNDLKQTTLILTEENIDRINKIGLSDDEEQFEIQYLEMSDDSLTQDDKYTEVNESSDNSKILEDEITTEIEIENAICIEENNALEVIENVPRKTANKNMLSKDIKIKFYDKELYTNVDYLEDENISKGLRKRQNSCHICSLQFISRTQLSNHRKTVHGSEFKCPDCSKAFLKADALRVHMKLHTGQPAFKCEMCNRTFNQKVHYKYHLDRHNNVRNFECDCGKAFLSKSDLNVHKRTHNNERPYECDICGKYFRMNEHLKMHRYSHFGKTLECKICKQKFTSPSTLRSHMKTIHSNTLFNCNLCSRQFRRKHQLSTHLRLHEKEENDNDELIDDNEFMNIIKQSDGESMDDEISSMDNGVYVDEVGAEV